MSPTWSLPRWPNAWHVCREQGSRAGDEATIGKEAGPIDILHLLDRLEDAIRSGWHMPGTSRCMVDETELQEIIESIRENIPVQMRQAQEVTRERDEILNSSKAEAERAIATAQAQALEMVQEQGLYKTAERE